MKLRVVIGLAAATLMLGGLGVHPAHAEDPPGEAQTGQARQPHGWTDAGPEALAAETPDGFAALPGYGMGGTTGGQGGRTVSASNIEELKTYASAQEPLIIVIHDSLKAENYVKIPVSANKSFIGKGAGAELVNAGFKLINVSNVIFRNFTIRDSYIPGDWDGKRSDNDRDGIQLDTSHHVWVDHMAFERLGDGLIDTRKDSDYLTYSWNVFADHNKALGVGWTANAVTHLTLHHNWIRNTVQRNASIDNAAAAHVYNNYLQDIGQYGMMGRLNAKIVLEGNYFKSVTDPVVAKDPNTQMVQRDNVFNGTRGRRDNVGPAFDPTSFYAYTKDAAADIPVIVSAGAGPLRLAQDQDRTRLTVALDGTGDFASIQAAIGACPSDSSIARSISI
jgi:pectate lyase